MKWYIQGLVFGYLSAPQRTGRQGRGLEMGDGHQEHSTRLGLAHSIELAAPLLLFFILKCVAPLALVELAARTVVGVHLWRSPGKALDRTNPGFSNRGSSRSTRPQLDRVEFPLFGLDRVRWSSWSVWPWNSSSFSACCLLLPLAQMRGSVRLLGREPPWSGEEDLLLGNVGALDFFFLLEEPETFFSKLLILLTILSMDFCIFPWLSLAICSPKSHSPADFSSILRILSSTQLDRVQAPLLANHPHAQLMCTRGSEVNVLTPTTVVSSGLGRRSLEGPANGCVNLNWNLPSTPCAQ
ncbi:unnamed protein product [Microthlaspi erraticum]|uniref:Uncharacterized protein n=1 Tax=Microthlaspi erraticum TaxID=1685480 RepID=A0A6D2K4W5_9BRAS|nr:unnamed protein product [Microthlaspi erraticum]